MRIFRKFEVRAVYTVDAMDIENSNSTGPNKGLRNKTCLFLATGCYSGFAPKGPGTAGSLAVLVLPAFVMWLDPSFSPELAPFYWLVLATFIFFLGIYAVNVVLETKHFGSAEDPKQVVIDEWAGMLIALVGLPFGWPETIAAFAFFRLFDIWKPTPIRDLEKLPGAWGIMLDDVAAGIMAWVLGYSLFFALNLLAHI